MATKILDIGSAVFSVDVETGMLLRVLSRKRPRRLSTAKVQVSRARTIYPPTDIPAFGIGTDPGKVEVWENTLELCS